MYITKAFKKLLTNSIKYGSLNTSFTLREIASMADDFYVKEDFNVSTYGGNTARYDLTTYSQWRVNSGVQLCLGAETIDTKTSDEYVKGDIISIQFTRVSNISQLNSENDGIIYSSTFRNDTSESILVGNVFALAYAVDNTITTSQMTVERCFGIMLFKHFLDEPVTIATGESYTFTVTISL